MYVDYKIYLNTLKYQHYYGSYFHFKTMPINEMVAVVGSPQFFLHRRSRRYSQFFSCPPGERAMRERSPRQQRLDDDRLRAPQRPVARAYTRRATRTPSYTPPSSHLGNRRTEVSGAWSRTSYTDDRAIALGRASERTTSRRLRGD